MSLKTPTLITALCCGACVPPLEDPRLNGLWKSKGYGMVVAIDGKTAESYGVAGATCVSEGKEPLGSLLDGLAATPTEDGQRIALSLEGEDHKIIFDRIPDLPAVCDTPRPNTPTGNFEAFVDYFATHYAFFDIYGVDWDDQVATVRPRINDSMSDAQLFEVLSTMIAPLKDGHVDLQGSVDGQDRVFEPNPGALYAHLSATANANGVDPEEVIDTFQTEFWIESVAGDLLGGNGTFAGQKFVQYGLPRPDVGYIGLVTMGGYANGEEGALQEDIAAIHDILDSALAQFRDAKVTAVILDVSLNFGGYDAVSLAVAERFASGSTYAFSKYAADSPDQSIGRFSITPSDRSRFTGPLYLVTSNMTVSAGEILAMALRALPQTVHVGMPTRGALSDVLTKQLPNGWEISLSNEVYQDHLGAKWEGRGIRPQDRIAVFPPEDPIAGHKAAITAVLDQLSTFPEP
ncbi:MAG: S41 family peptidase [Pseudomonadota bacterium]